MSCPSPAEPAPKTYLLSWREVLLALGRHSSATGRRQVRRLNEHYGGPILFPSGRGGQPRADKARLLAWWDGLDDTWAELDRRRRDRRASVAGRHPYGRTGTAVPEIAGGIHPRRAAP